MAWFLQSGVGSGQGTLPGTHLGAPEVAARAASARRHQVPSPHSLPFASICRRPIEQAQCELPLAAIRVHPAEQAQCELPLAAIRCRPAEPTQCELPLLSLAQALGATLATGVRFLFSFIRPAAEQG
jgi:hypothetical protein